MVAADRAGQAGRDGDDQHLTIREGMAHDGNEDGEGAPGSAGGKGQEHCHHEDDDRQHVLQCGSGIAQQVRHIILCTQQAGHAGQGPGEGEDQHGADHGLEALGDAGSEVLEGHHIAHAVEDEGEQQGNAAAQHKARRSVAVRKGGDEVHALKEAAGVDHAEDAGRDQHQHRGDQVDDVALRLGAVIHVVAVGTVGGGEQIAVFRVALIELHGAEVGTGEDEEQDHHQREQGVVVVGDGAQEHGKAVDTGAFRYAGGNGSRPAGYRGDDAHRRSGGVDQVGQLCAGDLLPVRDRAHDGAHGQAVEVVVHEDHHTQQQGGKLRTGPGVDVGGGPAAKGGRAAGLVHQGHKDAQHDKEHQNAHVAAVRKLGHHAAVLIEEQGVDGQLQIAVGI